MPKRTTSSGRTQPQLNCSDGAKMLIDQMKEHPEEFRGYAGKFTSMLDMAREANQGLQRNVKMSQRDAAAILAAAETHLYEVWLAEDVLTTIMRPKVSEEQIYSQAISNSTLYKNTTSNTGTGQYVEQAYQREMARHKLELEKYKMEDFKRRELEYAMRTTKPYKPFI